MSREPIANTEQAEAWNKDEGLHWAAHQDRYDALNFEFTECLLDAAAIADTDAVLDIGCGNGQTTRLAARHASNGRAIGFDLSAPMLERAAATAAEEGVANTIFEQGDAQVHPFGPGTFDVAISRFGVMFFNDPVVAFTNIRVALRSDGRLAFLCWQDLTSNEWLMTTAAPRSNTSRCQTLARPAPPDRSRSQTRNACRRFSNKQASQASESIRSKPRCDSATTPRTQSYSSKAPAWAERCSKALTTCPSDERWRRSPTPCDNMRSLMAYT